MSPIEYINCSIQAGPGPREPECVICKVEIEQDEVSILHSSCRNAFHRDCIDSWVKASRETSSARQTTCPLCRNTETSIIAAPPVRDREVHRFLQTDLQGEIREAWETQENTKLQADFMIEGFRDLTELRQRTNPYSKILGLRRAGTNPDYPSSATSQLIAGGTAFWSFFNFPNEMGSFVVPATEDQYVQYHHDNRFVRVADSFADLAQFWGPTSLRRTRLDHAYNGDLNADRLDWIPGHGARFEAYRDDRRYSHFAIYRIIASRLTYAVPIPQTRFEDARNELTRQAETQDEE